MIRHYYHVYADGQWNVPMVEHIHAIRQITDPMQITVGLVGSKANRDMVKVHFADTRVVKWVEADSGWEQVTLAVLRTDAHQTTEKCPILYAHTKGAGFPSRTYPHPKGSDYPFTTQDAWRRSMTDQCVGRWRDCVRLLQSYDAVGSYWLTEHVHPHFINPIFAGNFWWSTSAYIRRLPELKYTDRWDAERWIGLAKPTIHDFLPGWPDVAPFNQI